MNQEDKELLLKKDLCARMPWGVKVLYNGQVKEIQYIEPLYNELKLLDNSSNYTIGIKYIKPYLRPMSSMTEEEKWYIDDNFGATPYGSIESYSSCEGGYSEVTNNDIVGLIDWLNKNMFDYRGLIPKGLAVDCSNLDIY